MMNRRISKQKKKKLHMWVDLMVLAFTVLSPCCWHTNVYTRLYIRILGFHSHKSNNTGILILLKHLIENLPCDYFYIFDI